MIRGLGTGRAACLIMIGAGTVVPCRKWVVATKLRLSIFQCATLIRYNLLVAVVSRENGKFVGSTAWFNLHTTPYMLRISLNVVRSRCKSGPQSIVLPWIAPFPIRRVRLAY